MALPRTRSVWLCWRWPSSGRKRSSLYNLSSCCFRADILGVALGTCCSLWSFSCEIAQCRTLSRQFYNFLNGLLPWVEFTWPLPESLGRYRGTATLVSGGVATALLAVHTVRRQEGGARVPWSTLLMSAVFVGATTTFLLYWGVIFTRVVRHASLGCPCRSAGVQ